MSRRLNLPDSASVAVPDEAGRLFAPSAARNEQAIADLVERLAPATGSALELASGTGQHVVALGRRLPGLDWQPSDADPARIASIEGYRAEAALPNLRAPVTLDATAPGWGEAHRPKDLILLVNLLHLVSRAEAETLIREAAAALAPGGLFLVYGPFMRGGELTSAGDRRFHESLTAQDPEIGYKEVDDMLSIARDAGLIPGTVEEMPANNLTLVLRAPS